MFISDGTTSNDLVANGRVTDGVRDRLSEKAYWDQARGQRLNEKAIDEERGANAELLHEVFDEQIEAKVSEGTKAALIVLSDRIFAVEEGLAELVAQLVKLFTGGPGELPGDAATGE